MAENNSRMLYSLQPFHGKVRWYNLHMWLLRGTAVESYTWVQRDAPFLAMPIGVRWSMRSWVTLNRLSKDC